MEKSGLKFLADENISPVLVAILNKVGDRSVSSMHRENAYKGHKDEEWLPLATKRGYICVTCDRKMLDDRVLVAVLKETRAKMIFIARHFADSGIWDQALWLLKYWRKIKIYATTLNDGDLARVLRNGRIVPISLFREPRPRNRRSTEVAGIQNDSGSTRLQQPSLPLDV